MHAYFVVALLAFVVFLQDVVLQYRYNRNMFHMKLNMVNVVITLAECLFICFLFALVETTGYL